MAKQYVVGFAFNPEFSRVVLIEKLRPEWQVGYLNGVGGKIEEGEIPEGAMAREFEEETGIKTHPSDWYKFHRERYLDTGNQVNFLATVISWEPVTQTTDEKPGWYDTQPEIQHIKLLYNLHYLLPMARVFLQQPKHRYVET